MFDIALALPGLALAVFALIAPSRWPNMPKWVVDVGLLISGALLGAGIALFIVSETGEQPGVADGAHAIIQFYGNTSYPQLISQENVASVYSYDDDVSIESIGSGKSQKFSALFDTQNFPVRWVLFITFKVDTSYKTISLVSSLGDNETPVYQVFEQTPKSVAIIIEGNPARSALDIEFEN